jgi:membrane-associated protease RseP (regulator of RpoE activity)
MSARGIDEETQEQCTKCGAFMKVAGVGVPKELSEVFQEVAKRFEIEDFIATSTRAEFEVSPRNLGKSFDSLLSTLRPRGYIAAVREGPWVARLLVMKFVTPPTKRLAVNLGLFLATVASTFLAGYYLLFGTVVEAAMFSIAIMLILTTHELGHKISAWRHGVDASLPYFIPFPSFLGTLGAVMSIRSPPPSKDALVEMGATGPLAGFLVALPLLFIGLFRSVPSPQGAALPVAPLIFLLFQLGIFGQWGNGLQLHPLAFAGWVAMLLTMFNLIPAGQLDGGHVARGLMSGERHYTLTRVLGLSLIMTGFFAPELPLWIWGFFVFMFFRSYHPGALNDVSPLSGRSKALATATLIVFFLCLPVPTRW